MKHMNMLRKVTIEEGDFFKIYWCTLGDHPEVEKVLALGNDLDFVAVKGNLLLKMDPGFIEDNIKHFVEKVLHADSLDMFPGEPFSGPLQFSSIKPFNPNQVFKGMFTKPKAEL